MTGDVIGQVASQTLDNMTVIDQAAHMPVFRPLVGMDKEEIIAEAQRLGTFDISIVPDQDSCTLFTPRHPETHARRYTIDRGRADAAGRHHDPSARGRRGRGAAVTVPGDKVKGYADR